MHVPKVREKSTLHFEVAVRVNLKLETLTLKPQSTLKTANLFLKYRLRISRPIFNNLFMVRARVRVRIISVCDVRFNMSAGAQIKLQTVMCFFYPPNKRLKKNLLPYAGFVF